MLEQGQLTLGVDQVNRPVRASFVLADVGQFLFEWGAGVQCLEGVVLLEVGDGLGQGCLRPHLVGHVLLGPVEPDQEEAVVA